MSRIFIYSFFLLFNLLSICINANNDIDGAKSINLNKVLSFTKDQDFEPAMVVKGYYDSLFILNVEEKAISFPNSIKPFWIKINLDYVPELIKSDFYLKSETRLLLKLDLYYFNNKEEFLHHKSGYGYPLDSNQLNSIGAAFHIESISKQYRNIYIKLNSEGFRQILSLCAGNKPYMIGSIEKKNFFLGIKYGVFLLILILNAFYLLTTRNSIFFYYSIYIVLSILSTSVLDGMFIVIFQTPVSINLAILTIPGLFGFLPFMAFKFLQLTKKDEKVLFISVVAILAINLFMIVDGILVDNHKLFILKNAPLLFFVELFILVICIVKGIRKNKVLGFGFFLAELVLGTGLSLALLQSHGIITVMYGVELLGLSVVAEVIILSLTLAVRFGKIERISEKRKVELLELELVKKELEMKAFSSQMNPHFLFNSLNSIQRMYVEGKTDVANDYLSDFSVLLRKILNNTSKEFVTLYEDLEMLELYLELEKLRAEGQVSYQIIIDESINASSTNIPPLIIQPFVENAIWHGILPSKRAGEITITLTKEKENLLICTVEDNGVGYSFSQQNKVITHKSKGIQIVEQRLGVENAVIIEEVKTGGTLVTLKIPTV